MRKSKKLLLTSMTALALAGVGVGTVGTSVNLNTIHADRLVAAAGGRSTPNNSVSFNNINSAYPDFDRAYPKASNELVDNQKIDTRNTINFVSGVYDNETPNFAHCFAIPQGTITVNQGETKTIKVPSVTGFTPSVQNVTFTNSSGLQVEQEPEDVYYYSNSNMDTSKIPNNITKTRGIIILGKEEPIYKIVNHTLQPTNGTLAKNSQWIFDQHALTYNHPYKNGKDSSYNTEYVKVAPNSWVELGTDSQFGLKPIKEHGILKLLVGGSPVAGNLEGDVLKQTVTLNGDSEWKYTAKYISRNGEKVFYQIAPDTLVPDSIVDIEK